MNGVGPLLLTITPYKVVRNFVVFEAHMTPCPSYDKIHNDSYIKVSVFDKQTKKSFYWIKNRDAVVKEQSSLYWEQNFKNVDDINTKGYFIVPTSGQISIQASVTMIGYSCLSEQNISTFDVNSYMSNEKGHYYHSNGVVVQWKEKEDIIKTSRVEKGIYLGGM